MRFDVVTLFPDLFSGYLSQSLLEKAIRRGLVEVRLHNLRDWSRDKHHKVDDRPFGGGPGMVLKVEPVVECVEELQGQSEAQCDSQNESLGRVILLSPQGRRLDQTVVESLALHKRLILLCGRYEGFDQRVIDLLAPEEISLGDFILNGGEVAAMAVIDAVIRLVPGVLGDEQSSVDDSFSHGRRLLEFPQYTRPRVYRSLAAPEILFSGDHQAIARWRHEQSLLRTKQRRPDLLTPPDLDQSTSEEHSHGDHPTEDE